MKFQSSPAAAFKTGFPGFPLRATGRRRLVLSLLLAAFVAETGASATAGQAGGAALAAGSAGSAGMGLPVLAWKPVEGLPRLALAAALDAVSCARARGVAGKSDLLTLIDYSLPSTEPRLWVLDLAHGRVLFHELVAHGAGSGENYATHFSNAADSRESSLGLFLTGDTYEGGNGYSLRLLGLETGVNDQAEARKIVMHGAWYVSADQITRYGRLGRSWGCPALAPERAPAVIDAIKGGTFLYSYSAAASRSQAAASPGCEARGRAAGEPHRAGTR